MQSCVPSDRQKVYPVLKQLTSERPILTQIDSLLTPAECKYLVRKARSAGFDSSEIVGRGVDRSLRTSRTAYLPEDDTVVACIGRRLATVAGMPATSLQTLQATSYSRGQRYKSHHDDDGEGNTNCQRRLKTVFAYLQATGGLPAGECGGATAFYRLRGEDGRRPLRVYPQQGRALMWNNFGESGARDLRTLHGGEPVTCDAQKIGLNAWFAAEEVPTREESPRTDAPRGARMRTRSKTGSL